MAKKLSTTIGILILFAVITTVIIGSLLLYQNLSTHPNPFFAGGKDFSIKATFFDKFGNQLSEGTQQTTIGGQSGISYISFNIKVSNTGQVPLSNIRISNSKPSELTNALQNTSSISNLNMEKIMSSWLEQITPAIQI